MVFGRKTTKGKYYPFIKRVSKRELKISKKEMKLGEPTQTEKDNE